MAVLTAGVDLADSGGKQAPRPPSEPHEDAPNLNDERGSLFNGDSGHATVSLEATLARGGTLIWRGNVSGHADSLPCTEVKKRVREALDEAVADLREAVIGEIARAAP